MLQSLSIRQLLPISVLIVLAFAIVAVGSDVTPLTDEQVEQVIASAASTKEAGLKLTAWYQPVWVHTPIEWVKARAIEVAAEKKVLAVADVTDEMRKPVLRVRVPPAPPRSDTPEGANALSVVIRDTGKKKILDPSAKTDFGEMYSKLLTKPFELKGILAEFDLEGLAEIRAMDSKGEFLITIKYMNGFDEDLKVKQKHASRLAGLPSTSPSK